MGLALFTSGGKRSRCRNQVQGEHNAKLVRALLNRSLYYAMRPQRPANISRTSRSILLQPRSCPRRSSIRRTISWGTPRSPGTSVPDLPRQHKWARRTSEDCHHGEREAVSEGNVAENMTVPRKAICKSPRLQSHGCDNV